MKKYRIAIIVQNVIQWYHIRPLAIFLQKQPSIALDILLYNPGSSSSGFHKIANDAIAAIKTDGFTLAKTPKEYKICLAPYSNMINCKCQYRLSYCYGAATTKPTFTLNPIAKINFHGFLLHDTYGAEVFSVYGKTYIVPDLYLQGIRPNAEKHAKPIVLFLPTYHEPSIEKTAHALKQLKDKYYIIVKSHHGTDNLEDEKTKKTALETIADEFYPSTFPVKELLQKADVILSNNSGAVMNALYVNIPIAISASNINQSLPGLDTLQYKLVQDGIIPYSKNQTSTELSRILNQALSTSQHQKQIKASDTIFPHKSGGAETWYKIIQKYLSDDVETNYCAVHNFLATTFTNLTVQNNRLNVEMQSLQDSLRAFDADLQAANSKLQKYESSHAHRIINKAQKLFHRSA